MRLVIDETSWSFDTLAPDVCIDALETMLDRLDDAQEQGVLVCYSEDLFNTNVWQDKCFYDLYSADSPIQIPMEVRERIGTLFNSLEKWQDLPHAWPMSFNVKISGLAEEEAPSIAWAHKQTLDNTANAVACLIFPSGRQSGICNVTVNETSVLLWFVDENQHYVNFFRWLIIQTTQNPAQMEALSLPAFPSIDFVPGAFNGIKRMSKPYGELVECIVSHLGVLSDHGELFFSGPRDRTAAEFAAFGVDVSNENGRTRANNVARRERTIVFEDSEIIFWWHSKLERDRDRIHFSPDKLKAGGRLLVGIFCRHLTTT